MDHTTFAEWLTGLTVLDIAQVFDQLGRELQSRELHNLAFRADVTAEMTRDRCLGPLTSAVVDRYRTRHARDLRVGHGEEGMQ